MRVDGDCGYLHFVFEASGPYHLGLALALWEAKLALSVLNPARVRYFAKAQGKAKTDPLDHAQRFGIYRRSPPSKSEAETTSEPTASCQICLLV